MIPSEPVRTPLGAGSSSAALPPGTRSPSEVLAVFLAETAVTPLMSVSLPVRGVVSGPMGSGKSAALRALRDELAARGLTVGTMPADAGAVDVLLVDDAETLSGDELDALHAWAARPDASVVVAHAPARRGLLRRIGTLLEKTCPPVLLGEVTPEQIIEATRVPPHCAHALVRQTGGLTWLTLAAVDVHDKGVCDVDPAHRDVVRILRGTIAHRLDLLDAPHREGLEALCTLDAADLSAHPLTGTTWEEVIAHGSAAGLLAPNGAAPPVVRSAVRALVPVHRLSDHEHGDDDAAAWGDGAGAASPARLARRADRLRFDAPAQALALYREAAQGLGDDTALALPTGIAAFNAGDLDAAAAAFDRALLAEGHPSRPLAADASVAVWAARGVLEVGAASYRPPAGSRSAQARAALIALGTGRDLGRLGETGPADAPDTLTVASDVLTAALRASVGDEVESAVDDLVVASELYSATHSDFPLVEPVAVVAAAAALSTGRLGVAASVLDSAISRRQSGAWARPRLLLWRAWIAVHAADPDAAQADLDRVDELGHALLPRDRFIRAAVRTALARRYAPTAELLVALREATREVHQQRCDLFLFPFLGELALAEARTDAGKSTQRQLTAAFALLDRMGTPPLWSPLLHWYGIQRGILRGQPELLAPHAQGLLATAPRSPFAARLAEAGKVWTDVLAGRVDLGAVQQAATELNRQGLAWDGARLAAHGAARTGDRHVSAQLLACARDLHPHTSPRSPADRAEPSLPTADGTVLSAREAEVARLVLQGKTYVEIGQALFISPRTAEHHIARIRRRVDATTRSDLVTKLRAVLGADDPMRSQTQEGP